MWWFMWKLNALIQYDVGMAYLMSIPWIGCSQNEKPVFDRVLNGDKLIKKSVTQRKNPKPIGNETELQYQYTLSRRIKQFIIEFYRKFAAMALHAQ